MSDRGLGALRIPTGNASISQKMAPPNTSDAVTGAARSTMSLVLAVHERLAEGLLAHELPEEAAVLLPDRLIQVEPLGDPLHVLRDAPCPAARRAGSAGVT